jgi:hypothetical protein
MQADESSQDYAHSPSRQMKCKSHPQFIGSRFFELDASAIT